MFSANLKEGLTNHKQTTGPNLSHTGELSQNNSFQNQGIENLDKQIIILDELSAIYNLLSSQNEKPINIKHAVKLDSASSSLQARQSVQSPTNVLQRAHSQTAMVVGRKHSSKQNIQIHDDSYALGSGSVLEGLNFCKQNSVVQQQKLHFNELQQEAVSIPLATYNALLNQVHTLIEFVKQTPLTGMSGLMMTQVHKPRRRSSQGQGSRKRNRIRNKKDNKTAWGSLSDSDEQLQRKRNASAQNQKKTPFIKLPFHQGSQPMVSSFNTQNNNANKDYHQGIRNHGHYQTAQDTFQAVSGWSTKRSAPNNKNSYIAPPQNTNATQALPQQAKIQFILDSYGNQDCKANSVLVNKTTSSAAGQVQDKFNMDEMLGEGWGTARNSLFGSQATTPRLANTKTELNKTNTVSTPCIIFHTKQNSGNKTARPFISSSGKKVQIDLQQKNNHNTNTKPLSSAPSSATFNNDLSLSSDHESTGENWAFQAAQEASKKDVRRHVTNFCVPKLNLGKLNQPPPPPQKDTSFGEGMPMRVNRNEDPTGVMSFIDSAKVSPIKNELAQDNDLSFEARQTKLVFEDINQTKFEPILYRPPIKKAIEPYLKIKQTKMNTDKGKKDKQIIDKLRKIVIKQQIDAHKQKGDYSFQSKTIRPSLSKDNKGSMSVFQLKQQNFEAIKEEKSFVKPKASPLMPRLKPDKFSHLILDRSPRLKKDNTKATDAAAQKNSLQASSSKKSLLQAFPESLVMLNKEILQNKIPRFQVNKGLPPAHSSMTPRIQSFGSVQPTMSKKLLPPMPGKENDSRLKNRDTFREILDDKKSIDTDRQSTGLNSARQRANVNHLSSQRFSTHRNGKKHMLLTNRQKQNDKPVLLGRSSSTGMI